MHFDITSALTLGAMALNVAWSAVNLRILTTIKDAVLRECVSRIECDGKHALADERHSEVCRRLDHAGA